jgi:lipopolysaccharide transport system permease protein
MIGSLWRNRRLTIELASRSVLSRYRGSILGLAWSLVTPILLLVTYTFVFSVIFDAKWNEASDNEVQFSVILFSGLILHSLLSDLLNKVPGLIAGNANFVKKLVFPLEVLVPVELLGGLFNALIGCCVLLAIHFYFGGQLNSNAAFAPLIIISLIPCILGFSWFIAATGVYFRDLGHLMPIITMLFLFLCPIFYPLNAIPEAYQHYLLLNPLTIPIEQFRATLLFGIAPDWVLLAKYFCFSLATMVVGFWWFQVTRRGFSDVI